MHLGRIALLACCLLAWVAWAGAAVAETLSIPGTGDSQAMLRAMAPLFEARHPGAVLDIPDSVGSSGGVKAVLDGDFELGRVARPLTDKERAAGLVRRVFAWSPVVFAANLPATAQVSLTFEQIVGVYDGSIRDYALLGGKPGKIYPVMRERGDSCLSAINQVVPGFGDIETPVGKVYYTTPETVEALSAHPGALGYVPLSGIRGSGLKILAVQGVEPTPDNVRREVYPLAVPLGLIHKGGPGPLARAFMEFIDTPEAGRVMERFGCVPAAQERP